METNLAYALPMADLHPQPLEMLEKKIGIKFKNYQLLEEALTHKSFSMEDGRTSFNERLEFLGDSILNASVTDFLFKRYPDEDEGKLSKLKSHLVAKPSLVKWAKDLKIGPFIRMSTSEEATGGRERDSIIANAVEALIGAVYLDQGFDRAHGFILQKLSQRKRIVETDYKSKLQELIQKKFRMPPTYILVGEDGPDHNKIFHMEARIKKKLLGKGQGRSKKESEQAAARAALKKIRKSKAGSI